MNIHQYLQALLKVEGRLAEQFIKTAEYHKSEPGIYYECQELAALSNEQVRVIKKESDFLELSKEENKWLIKTFITEHYPGLNLNDDLRYLWLLTKEAELLAALLHSAYRDNDESKTPAMYNSLRHVTAKQSSWIFSKLRLIPDAVPEGR